MQNQASDQSSEFSLLKHGWVVVLASLAVFITFNNLTGIHLNRWETGIPGLMAVAAGDLLCRMRPHYSLMKTNLLLAGITLALAIPTVIVVQILH